MQRCIQFIPYAEKVSFWSTPLSMSTVKGIVRVLNEHKHMNNMKYISFHNSNLNDDMLNLLSPYLSSIREVGLSGKSSLTVSGYQSLAHAIIMQGGKHRVWELEVNDRDVERVRQLLQHVRPQIDVKEI